MKNVPNRTPSRIAASDQQVPAGADADHADRQGRDLRVAHEPQRSEMPELAVPLVERDIVDRSDFDGVLPHGRPFTPLVAWPTP
jgi:hypothetical protein